MALAHTISSKVEAAYRRGDLFREAEVVDVRLGNILRVRRGSKIISISA
jgi:hypothetical protein